MINDNQQEKTMITIQHSAHSEKLHDTSWHSDETPEGEEKHNEHMRQLLACSHCEDNPKCKCWLWTGISHLLGMLIICLNGCSTNNEPRSLDANCADVAQDSIQEPTSTKDSADEYNRTIDSGSTHNEAETTGIDATSTDCAEETVLQDTQNGGDSAYDARTDSIRTDGQPSDVFYGIEGGDGGNGGIADGVTEDNADRPCVPSSCDACALDIVDLGNGTALDQRSCRVWQIDVSRTSTTYTQTNAIAYCAGLTLAGGGWHLPYIAELQSIVDTSTTGPATIPLFSLSAVFWSQSLVWGDATLGYGIDFYDGTTAEHPVTGNYNARCVR